MTGLWKVFAEMPSTNLRIALTLLLMFGTGARVILTGWMPPLEWCGVLTVWAGLDIAQFGTKRTTDSGYVAAKQGASPPEEPKPPEVGT